MEALTSAIVTAAIVTAGSRRASADKDALAAAERARRRCGCSQSAMLGKTTRLRHRRGIL
jgi:hypothetical protein